MHITETECVSCGLPCMGSACPYHSVTRYYCDKCGDETTLYHFEDQELCISCIEDSLERVDGSE